MVVVCAVLRAMEMINPIMSIERHPYHINGNGHLIDSSSLPGRASINGYDNPVHLRPRDSDYMPGIC